MVHEFFSYMVKNIEEKSININISHNDNLNVEYSKVLFFKYDIGLCMFSVLIAIFMEILLG